ncbi:hypothetical protein ACIOHE_14645 [Streptomyces sp. NPDC087851]|uniref:hypothetical protein n=1 Tax=unclassified Streptomyces TaxID=2593676 RepID=UPI002E77E4F8|nr:hypothetical protein [Streptomyces sp. JV176]
MATPVLPGRHGGAPVRTRGAHRTYEPSRAPGRSGRSGAPGVPGAPGGSGVQGARSGRSGRHISPLVLGVPLFLGIAYGAYAQAIARSGGPATWGQLALALISGAAFALLLFGLLRVEHSLPRELRAAAWGVLVGGSIGFLYSLTGHSVLLSSGIGLAIGAGTVIATFYRFYTREP